MQKFDKTKILNNPLWTTLPLLLFVLLLSIYFNRFNLDFFTEGDLGRDLYNYYLVSKGLLPYIDFNWIYGPLSPILYGFSFKLFGISVFNAASLWYFFFFMSMMAVFYLVKTFSNYFLASIASLYFLAYYGMTIITFNHILGTFLILMLLVLLKLYLSTFKAFYVFLLSIISFLLLYTKINMGLAVVIPLYLVLFVYNFTNIKSQKDTVKSLILLVLLAFIGYLGLIAFSPDDQILKSFPFLNSDMMSGRLIDLNGLLAADAGSVVFKFIRNKLLFKIFYVSSLNILYIIAIVFSVIYSVYYYRKNQFDVNLAFIAVLTISSILCMNEFVLVSTFYSLRYWVMPQVVVLLAFIIYQITLNLKGKKIPKFVILLLMVLLILPLSVKLYAAFLYVNLPSVKTNYEKLGVSVYDENWYDNLIDISDYVENNTEEDDKLFTIPYNAIYNFILKRERPSRVDEFFLLSGVTEKDEERVIRDLEDNRVKIIIYNPLLEGTVGVGKFGETHCKKLYTYINLNYAVAEILNHSPNNVPMLILSRTTDFISK